jgi:hypothetical protein
VDIVALLPQILGGGHAAGPAPMTPMLSGRSRSGVTGFTQPLSKAVSKDVLLDGADGDRAVARLSR